MTGEATKTLEYALEVLSQPDAWHQGSLSHVSPINGTLQLCIIGAVMQAPPGSYLGAIKRLCDIAGIERVAEDYKGVHPLALWNDEATRTQEDVILLLKRAIHG